MFRLSMQHYSISAMVFMVQNNTFSLELEKGSRILNGQVTTDR